MGSIVCPVCGLSDFEIHPQAEDGLAAAAVWTDAFVQRCQHVQERRHRADLKSHTCPHWARAVQDAAEQVSREASA